MIVENLCCDGLCHFIDLLSLLIGDFVEKILLHSCLDDLVHLSFVNLIVISNLALLQPVVYLAVHGLVQCINLEIVGDGALD